MPAEVLPQKVQKDNTLVINKRRKKKHLFCNKTRVCNCLVQSEFRELNL